MTRFVRNIMIASLALGVAHPMPVRAQTLGPQRQFLALEPYYEGLQLPKTAGQASQNVNGYGVRLWINGAPFHFPVNSSIALFVSRSSTSVSAFKSTSYFYGGQVDEFLVRRPLFGLIDPFVSVALGAYRTSVSAEACIAGAAAGTCSVAQTNFALAPGGGIRIPIPNRFQVRFDARDLIVANGSNSSSGKKERTNRLLYQAAFGITF